MVSTRRNPNLGQTAAKVKQDHQGRSHVENRGATNGEDSSEQDQDLPPPRKKRTRTSQLTKSSNTRKYVKGKRGGLSSFMKLPVEIFTQIAYLLSPGDLIALARSNKFFNNMLLQRSAIQMWRRAEANVPELPPCPPDMSEPQYAALLFSKHCSLCGSSATAKPDTELYVRLCASCRDTSLKELNPKRDDPPFDISLVHWSIITRPTPDKSEPRTSRNSVFSLNYEVDEVLEKQKEFRRRRDRKGLAEWEAERRLVVSARRRHAVRLELYLESIDILREDELGAIKQQRREAVAERLKALGWTERDMDFYGPEAKPWRALVEAPKPLTDRVWTNILPKLTPLLEENRKENLAYDKKKSRVARRTRVDKLLMEMKYTAHPYRSMLDALGVGVPSLPDLNGRSTMVKQALISKHLPAIPNPFPRTHITLNWACLNDLSEMDMSISEVETKLEERKTQIEERVQQWRTSIERRLVEKIESGNNIDGDVILSVRGSTDSTAHLSRDARILLRADTLFKREGDESVDAILQRFKYYPSPVCSGAEIFTEDVRYPYTERKDKLDFSPWVRDTKAQKIAKSLLRDLGVPDIGHIELKLMGSRFVCGRCIDRIPSTWQSMIYHYIGELQHWDAEKGSMFDSSVHHPIAVKNVHELEQTSNLKPLVRLLTEEDATEMDALANPVSSTVVKTYSHCYLCHNTGRPGFRLGSNDIRVHLEDVHDVLEPVDGIHFGSKPLLENPDQKWLEKWDAFHDARTTGTGVMESSSTSG